MILSACNKHLCDVFCLSKTATTNLQLCLLWFSHKNYSWWLWHSMAVIPNQPSIFRTNVVFLVTFWLCQKNSYKKFARLTLVKLTAGGREEVPGVPANIKIAVFMSASLIRVPQIVIFAMSGCRQLFLSLTSKLWKTLL